MSTVEAKQVVRPDIITPSIPRLPCSSGTGLGLQLLPALQLIPALRLLHALQLLTHLVGCAALRKCLHELRAAAEERPRG
jgi:hypothetical protein